MPAPPFVAPSWRPACAGIVVASIALVATLAGVLHDRHAATGLDTWVARPLFAHVGEDGRLALLAVSYPLIPIIGLTLIALIGAVRRTWEVVVVAAAGPILAIVLTELVLKPTVHRQLSPSLVDDAFPSGHETGLVSLLVVVALLLPRAHWSRGRTMLAAAALAVWAALGAIGLVRGHYHYITDTIGGFGVAVACVLGVALLTDAVSARVGLSSPDARSPARTARAA